MKISTKNGDEGETRLFDGQKLRKSSRIFEVLGNLDELQSFLGFCKFGKGIEEDIVKTLEILQDDLYRLMAILGKGDKDSANDSRVSFVEVCFLEREIEKLEKTGGDLNKFIRPGVNEAGARFHIARTICRRTERVFVKYLDSDEIDEVFKNSAKMIEVLKYLNRLSDLLFLLGENT